MGTDLDRATLLAPRRVAHAWALEGEEPCRLLIAFQPAGQMEAFFAATRSMTGLPPPNEIAPLFEAQLEHHGPAATGQLSYTQAGDRGVRRRHDHRHDARELVSSGQTTCIYSLQQLSS